MLEERGNETDPFSCSIQRRHRFEPPHHRRDDGAFLLFFPLPPPAFLLLLLLSPSPSLALHLPPLLLLTPSPRRNAARRPIIPQERPRSSINLSIHHLTVTHTRWWSRRRIRRREREEGGRRDDIDVTTKCVKIYRNRFVVLSFSFVDRFRRGERESGGGCFPLLRRRRSTVSAV
jgi:hypothetical protein